MTLRAVGHLDSAGKRAVCGTCGTVHRVWYDRIRRRTRDLRCGPYRIYLDLEVRRVDCRRCGKVKRERLDFLLENALHAERFARYVGRRCCTGTIKDIAKEMNLDWQTVKRLQMRYMRAQLKRAAKPSPQTLGIDQISIRESQVYRIVVSDLHRQRPIWFGGEERSEQSMDEFYRILGEKKARRVRKQEYAPLSGKGRAFIKGQKYALLAHPHNLEGSARKNLKRLLSAKKRLNTAYLLKESFGQMWDYRGAA